MESEEKKGEVTKVFIKCAFSCTRTSSAFYIELDEESGSVTDSLSAVKPGTLLEPYDVNATPDQFKEIIMPLREKALSDDALSPEVLMLDETISQIPDEKTVKIVNLISSSGEEYLKVSLVKDVLKEAISHSVKDIEGRMELAYSKIIPQGTDPDLEVKETGENVEEQEKVLVETHPDLDPVKGKKSSKITVGDLLILRLANEEDLSEYSEELEFHIKSDELKIARVIGEVKEITTPELEVTGRTAIKLKLSDNLESVLYLSGVVKLGTIAKEEEPVPQDESTAQESSFKLDLKDKTIIVLMVTVSILLVLILIVILTMI